MTQLAMMLWQVVIQVKRLRMLHKREYRIKFVGLSGLEIPVPALCGLSGTHQRSQIHGDEVSNLHVHDFRKKVSVWDRKFAKIRKRGLIYPTLIE